MKKRKFNGQIINRIRKSFPIKEKIQLNKYEEKLCTNRLVVNLSSSLKNSLRKNQKKDLSDKNYLYMKIVSNNLKKYTLSPQKLNIMMINNLIKCKSSHFLAKFKEHLIMDYKEEFLRRIYLKKEFAERMNKIYNYYKNYLKFFCKPTFIVPFANEIIKNYSDLNAECFYKNNLEKKNVKNINIILDRKITGNEKNDNNLSKENNLENESKNSEKAVFTKSVKNSIDNINADDISLSEKKSQKFSENFSDSIVKIFGNDEDDNNIPLNNNSLLSIVNEIKDIKDSKNNNQKLKIKEKTIKMRNSMNNNGCTFSRSVNNFKKIKTRNNNNNENEINFGKLNTCANNFGMESLKNMIYSPKSNKIGFFLKKNNNNKIERYLSPKLGKINLGSSPKNRNSIIVNINININTNKENINNNINTANNILNNNLVYKSPSHNVTKTKNFFAFSPISSSNINNYQNYKPVLSERNEQNKKYMKIIKRRNNYKNKINNTDRYIKVNDTRKARTLCSVESLEIFKYHNYSCNKNSILFNKQNENELKKNKQKEQSKINKININKNEIYSRNMNEIINNNIYFNSNKTIKNQKFIDNNKYLESNNNNKKFVYQKKSNNSFYSKLKQKHKLEKNILQKKKYKFN